MADPNLELAFDLENRLIDVKENAWNQVFSKVAVNARDLRNRLQNKKKPQKAKRKQPDEQSRLGIVWIIPPFHQSQHACVFNQM